MFVYLFVLQAQQQHLLHQRQARLLRVVVIELLFVLVASHVVVIIAASAAAAVGTAVCVSCVSRAHSAHQTVGAIHGVELWGLLLCVCVSVVLLVRLWLLASLCLGGAPVELSFFSAGFSALCSVVVVVSGQTLLRQIRLFLLLHKQTEKNAHTRSQKTHPRTQNYKLKHTLRALVRILFDDVVRGCC